MDIACESLLPQHKLSASYMKKRIKHVTYISEHKPGKS